MENLDSLTVTIEYMALVDDFENLSYTERDAYLEHLRTQLIDSQDNCTSCFYIFEEILDILSNHENIDTEEEMQDYIHTLIERRIENIEFLYMFCKSLRSYLFEIKGFMDVY